MNLLRLIAIGILIWLAISVAKRYLAQAKSRVRPLVRNPQDMVRCDHCGVHFPKEQALRDEGRHYCSEAHRQLDKAE